MLAADEARTDEIAITSAVGLRDRALIGLMVYTFARVGTVIKGILAHLENRLDVHGGSNDSRATLNDHRSPSPACGRGSGRGD